MVWNVQRVWLSIVKLEELKMVPFVSFRDSAYKWLLTWTFVHDIPLRGGTRISNTQRQRNSRSYIIRKNGQTRYKEGDEKYPLRMYDVHDDNACFVLLRKYFYYEYEDMNVQKGKRKSYFRDWDTRALAIIHDPFLLQSPR